MTSKASRFNPKNPVSSIFNKKQQQRSSMYSIDIPKDTRYLKVERGHVSPLGPEDWNSRSPSPIVSDVSSMEDIRPPVPLKARTFGLRKQSASQSPAPAPAETRVKVPEIALNKRPQGGPLTSSPTNVLPKSPELPTLGDLDVGLRDHLEPHMPGSRFSWTTVNTDATKLPISPEQSPDFSNMPGKSDDDVPRSRFSWTTYNTQRSPPTTSGKDTLAAGSDIYSAPMSPPPSPPSPVLSRRRPIARPDSHLNVVKRKPTPSVAASQAGAPEGESPQSKELPLAPPELASVDRVTALQAQLDEAQHRRFNMEKVIHSLQVPHPQNPVVQDLSRRRADRERLANFEAELAEVRNKEHDIGMRLHRALKRRDQEEPSGLWVRRVTS